jgi:hypothetical protein
MLELVVSGGQTGADQAGWRAATAAGIVCGGWMPARFMTEDGPRPEFAGLYGAREHHSSSYRDRTILNLRSVRLTLLFGNPNSPGGRLVLNEGNRLVLFVYPIRSRRNPAPDLAVDFIRQINATTINVAGNRESSAPGIGSWVEAYLGEVFRSLKSDA